MMFYAVGVITVWACISLACVVLFDRILGPLTAPEPLAISAALLGAVITGILVWLIPC